MNPTQQCHSPAEIFSFFSKDEDDEKDNSVIAEDDHEELVEMEMDESLAAAISPYPLPLSCEYCGAKSTKECPTSCSRPPLYLSKKRPPFLAPPTLQTEWNGSQVGPCDSNDMEAFETASSTISNFNEEKKDWMSEIGWRG